MAVDSAVIQRFHPREGEVGRKVGDVLARIGQQSVQAFPSQRRRSRSESSAKVSTQKELSGFHPREGEVGRKA